MVEITYCQARMASRAELESVGPTSILSDGGRCSFGNGMACRIVENTTCQHNTAHLLKSVELHTPVQSRHCHHPYSMPCMEKKPYNNMKHATIKSHNLLLLSNLISTFHCFCSFNSFSQLKVFPLLDIINKNNRHEFCSIALNKSHTVGWWTAKLTFAIQFLLHFSVC